MMAYTDRNFRSKAELKRSIANGDSIGIFNPSGLFPVPRDGKVSIEGPHYPEPHRWYGMATVSNGKITEVK
jgi:hypothetical protein